MTARTTVGLAFVGVIIGVAVLVAGWMGLLVAAIAGLLAVRAAPRQSRVAAAGVMLASAGFTIAVLLGRVWFSAAGDPSESLAPGTGETAVAALIVGLSGTVAAVSSRVLAGGSSRGERREHR
jgi:hypothetical protein